MIELGRMVGRRHGGTCYECPTPSRWKEGDNIAFHNVKNKPICLKCAEKLVRNNKAIWLEEEEEPQKPQKEKDARETRAPSRSSFAEDSDESISGAIWALVSEVKKIRQLMEQNQEQQEQEPEPTAQANFAPEPEQEQEEDPWKRVEDHNVRWCEILGFTPFEWINRDSVSRHYGPDSIDVYPLSLLRHPDEKTDKWIREKGKSFLPRLMEGWEEGDTFMPDKPKRFEELCQLQEYGRKYRASYKTHFVKVMTNDICREKGDQLHYPQAAHLTMNKKFVEPGEVDLLVPPKPFVFRPGG